MKTDVRQAEIAQTEFEEIARLQQEEAQWRESRQEELAEIKKRKDRRRGVLSGSLHEGEKEEDRGVDDFTGDQDDALDPEERRRQFEEYRHRTGLTVNAEEDFDGFITRDSDFIQKRLSTPMEREEEAETSAVS